MSILTILGTIATISVLSVVYNVFRQLFFRDPRRPPEVFHFLPVIGSTILYGMDPYAFFFKCRAKVREIPRSEDLTLTAQYGDWFHLYPSR